MTIPQVLDFPFSMLVDATGTDSTRYIQQAYIHSTTGGDSSNDMPTLLGARDDCQFGYPILPRPLYTIPPTGVTSSAQKAESPIEKLDPPRRTSWNFL